MTKPPQSWYDEDRGGLYEEAGDMNDTQDKCPFCGEPVVEAGVVQLVFRCGTYGPDGNGLYVPGHTCDIQTYNRVIERQTAEIEKLRVERQSLEDSVSRLRENNASLQANYDAEVEENRQLRNRVSKAERDVRHADALGNDADAQLCDLRELVQEFYDHISGMYEFDSSDHEYLLEKCPWIRRYQ